MRLKTEGIGQRGEADGVKHTEEASVAHRTPDEALHIRIARDVRQLLLHCHPGSLGTIAARIEKRQVVKVGIAVHGRDDEVDDVVEAQRPDSRLEVIHYRRGAVRVVLGPAQASAYKLIRKSDRTHSAKHMISKAVGKIICMSERMSAIVELSSPSGARSVAQPIVKFIMMSDRSESLHGAAAQRPSSQFVTGWMMEEFASEEMSGMRPCKFMHCPSGDAATAMSAD